MDGTVGELSNAFGRVSHDLGRGRRGDSGKPCEKCEHMSALYGCECRTWWCRCAKKRRYTERWEQ